MAKEGYKRKISAILSADVVGYSRLMEDDESATVSTLEAYRETTIIAIDQHRGRVIDSPGDNILSEFASVVDAVQCAVEIQQIIKAKNADLPDGREMEFRIGINLGDVIEEGDRIYGDGVNLASRIENIADPGSICISGSAYEQIKTKLALGYEDLGEHSVKNISEPVRVYRIPMDAKTTSNAGKTRGKAERKWRNLAIALSIVIVLLVGVAAWYLLSYAPLTDVDSPQKSVASFEKPSIAVLPFDNMSGDPKEEFFADGITEEIISRLSCYSMLTVIARNSTFSYKGKPIDIQKIGKELNVRNVLEGSVRKSGKKIRVTAQLIDTSTGAHIWAEKYDQELRDIFDIQDDIALQIGASLRVKYVESERKRVRHIPTDNMTAYETYWRGADHFYRLTKEDIEKAQGFFRRAIAMDPDFAEAHAALGHTYYTQYMQTFEPSLLDQAIEMGRKALEVDDASSEGHKLLAMSYNRKGDKELALKEVERTLSLDPNDYYAYRVKGTILEGRARYPEAIEHYEKAIRLNPADRGGPLMYMSGIYRHMGKLEDAISAAKEAISTQNHELPWSAYSQAFNYLTSWITLLSTDPAILDEALALAKQYITLRNQPTGQAMGLIHLHKKQYDQAIIEANKLDLFMPGYPVQKHRTLVQTYTYTGEYENAIDLARETIKMSPGNVDFLIYLGHALRLGGNRIESESALREYLAKPDSSYINLYLAHVELAKLYGESGRKNEAKSEADAILKLVPHFSVAVYGQRVPYENPAQTQRDMEALWKAGLK